MYEEGESTWVELSCIIGAGGGVGHATSGVSLLMAIDVIYVIIRLEGRIEMSKRYKRFKSARQQDAEYRAYEWNPIKCYMCEEVLASTRMYKNIGDRKVCLLCLKTANDMGETLGI